MGFIIACLFFTQLVEGCVGDPMGGGCKNVPYDDTIGDDRCGKGVFQDVLKCFL